MASLPSCLKDKVGQPHLGRDITEEHSRASRTGEGPLARSQGCLEEADCESALEEDVREQPNSWS